MILVKEAKNTIHWVKNPAIALQNNSIGMQKLSIKFKVRVNAFCCQKTKHGDDYHNYDDNEDEDKEHDEDDDDDDDIT